MAYSALGFANTILIIDEAFNGRSTINVYKLQCLMFLILRDIENERCGRHESVNASPFIDDFFNTVDFLKIPSVFYKFKSYGNSPILACGVFGLKEDGSAKLPMIVAGSRDYFMVEKYFDKYGGMNQQELLHLIDEGNNENRVARKKILA